MLGYTGARKLSSSILVYLRNRIYHPELGRFLQADPIGYGDGMNMYGYVHGDLVNRSDPSGLGCVFNDIIPGDIPVYGDNDRFEPNPSIGQTGSAVGGGGCDAISLTYDPLMRVHHQTTSSHLRRINMFAARTRLSFRPDQSICFRPTRR